jgi:hypothetical protein
VSQEMPWIAGHFQKLGECQERALPQDPQIELLMLTHSFLAS